MTDRPPRRDEPAAGDESAARDPVEELLDAYLTARRQGGAPDLEAHVARAGPRADELRELIDSAVMLDELKVNRPRGLSLHTSQVLGDYRIVAEIGRGGMGVVYEAEQITLGRPVAVKVLPPQALRSESRLQRFRREAQTAAKLHHTNIVPVFGVGEQDGAHYYVMQLIVGRPLDEVMRALRGDKAPVGTAPRRGSGSMALSATSAAEALRAGTFAPKAEHKDVGAGDAAYYRSVAALGLQVADALTYAHAQGTLHRDIKPANLILDAHGVVWVTDFGLAKVIEDESFTHSGDLVGTLQYMAPEQLSGHADARTDVHGLGLVLYELTTLQPAFVADSRGELVDRVRNQEPLPAGRVRQGVPRDLETIIRKATAKEPSHRYTTAAELREDLERFLQDRPIRARPVSAIESGWRWCRRNRLLASVGAVAVLGLASTAVVGVYGYVSTGQALQRAVAATKLAEDNVSLALAGFESVFARVVGPDMLRADDDEEGDVVAPGVKASLSANDQDLLVEMLRVYDQLAASNRGNAAARQLTARAYHRVGEIHLQLGKPAEAVANYERSVGLYAELVADGAAPLGTLMQVENGLCRACWSVGRDEMWAGRESANADAARAAGDRARASFERAAGLAESVLRRGSGADAATPLVRFECARAHELLAQLAFGRGPGGRRGGDAARRGSDTPGEAPMSSADHYRAALALHESLLAEDANNAAYRHATARGCLLVARAALWSRQGRDPERREEVVKLQQRALDLLQPLAAQMPHRPQYRQALIMALTLLPPDMPLRGGRRFDRWTDAVPADAEQIARHRQAVELAEGLVQDFPGVEEFARTLGEVALKTASMLAATDAKTARTMAQRAVALAESSARERPDDIERATLAAYANVRLAQTLWRGGANDEAVAAYRRAKELYDAHERSLGEAGHLRVFAAEQFLRAGNVAQARIEAAEADGLLERLQAGRERESGGRGGFGDPTGALGRMLGSFYERLSKAGGASEADSARDRARADSLRERYERRDPPRRNQ